MSDRLIPEHFKDDGSPKTGYGSEQAAVEARGNARDGIYRCGFCGLWHRTHKPSRSSRRKYPKAVI